MTAPRRWPAIATAAALVTTALMLTACGGGGSGAGGGSASGELPSEIKLVGVHDLTGPVAYAGVGAANGGALAVEEINKQEFLGKGVKLVLEEVDTAGSIETATSEMTKVMGDRKVAAIIGPAQSQQAAAVAPLVERAKVPTVFTQAGSEGVVIGDYTFRATAPIATYYHLAGEYLAAKGLTKVSVIYNATFITFAELAEKVIPKLAAEHGLNIVSSVPVQATTQDFTAPTRTIANAKPNAVFMHLTAPQAVTFLTQLRQAGYTGQVIGASMHGGGNIAEAGEHGVGVIYPTDFSPAQEDERAKQFVAAYQQKFGKLPDVYAADGYDAVWWIARAIKASGSATREGIKDGLKKVAAEGFEGVRGTLTFEGNDLRVPGVLVQWDGTKEVLVKAS